MVNKEKDLKLILNKTKNEKNNKKVDKKLKEENKKESNKTKKNLNKLVKIKVNKKMKGGDNIFQASINLIMSSIDLGGQIFKTVDGIMDMPSDLKKGIKNAELPPAQPAPSPKQTMPNKQLQDAKNVPIR